MLCIVSPMIKVGLCTFCRVKVSENTVCNKLGRESVHWSSTLNMTTFVSKLKSINHTKYHLERSWEVAQTIHGHLSKIPDFAQQSGTLSFCFHFIRRPVSVMRVYLPWVRKILSSCVRDSISYFEGWIFPEGSMHREECTRSELFSSDVEMTLGCSNVYDCHENAAVTMSL